MLYLDAGVEARGSLDEIRSALQTRGYFLVANKDEFNSTYNHPDTFRSLGLEPDDFGVKAIRHTS